MCPVPWCHPLASEYFLGFLFSITVSPREPTARPPGHVWLRLETEREPCFGQDTAAVLVHIGVTVVTRCGRPRSVSCRFHDMRGFGAASGRVSTDHPTVASLPELVVHARDLGREV